MILGSDAGLVTSGDQCGATDAADGCGDESFGESRAFSGEAIDAKATDVVISGRLVRTCCPKCAAKAKADPKGTLAKVDAEIAAGGKVDR